MKAIVISGLPAAGKTTVGSIVAERLHLKVIGGGDVLKEMAEELGFKVTGEGWWDTPEGMKFVERRRQIPDFDKIADEKLMKKANDGDVVITSYTLPWICRECGINVWLNGSVEKRGERMSARDGIPVEESIKITKERDEKNINIYKSIYGMDFGKDLSPFDIKIDTDNIDAEEVADTLINDLKEIGILTND